MIDTSEELSRKMYYSISEVCVRTGLEPHVLRYWESEFSQLRPKKNRAGNRAYREKDIAIIEYIKFLLYDQQFTIPGAKKKLSESKEAQELPVDTVPEQGDEIAAEPLQQVLPLVVPGGVDKKLIIDELQDLLAMLKTKD